MEWSDDFYIPTNEYQTEITKDFMESLPEEVAEQLLDFITNVPYIKNLISPDRKRAKDLPRDEKGRIIVNLEEPHILEDMDYFRPAAIHYEAHGCYTFLRPNPNPNSEFRKWLNEEKRRCREGYVRKSDGEWITGYMYWYMNYCRIMLTSTQEGKKRANRIESFPETWEGIYLRFHYLYQAREEGHHAIELSRRGSSKSYTLASMMAHNLVLGESFEVCKRVTTILTAYQKEYLADKDGTLSKFEPMINFISENTEFPRLRLRSSSQDMFWQMGYLDSYGRKKGSLNSVIGVSSKDDEGKLRGKRGHIYFEEMGSFPNLLTVFDVVRQGMEEGDYTYGLAYLVGTAAEKESNFESAKTLLYSPVAYNIKAINNVYDKPKQGNSLFGYFFPAYMNRKGCYNHDGVSDIVKGIVQLLTARYTAKYSSDSNSVLRVIAEMPITPAEAIIKVKSAFFPITALTERLQQLDLDPKAYDDVLIGDLVQDANGVVKFVPTNDVPIRKYGVDNTTIGALEIYELPKKDASNKIPSMRYIIGHDPVDNDQADSSSLSSTFVLDLFTDRIVAEYTGRHPFADDNFEMVRLLCLFYNALCLYEAHPYSQLVPTPDGMKFWKDIKIGDTLFSPTKNTVKVVDIPIDEMMPIYEITLADGRTIQASDNHIWTVYKGASRKLVEMTTKQMLDEGITTKWNQHKFFIPEHTGVEFSYKKLPIDPYTFGLILSEGSIRGSHCSKNSIQISSSFEDMKFYKNNIPYSIKHIGTKGYLWHIYISNCKTIMQKYDIYGTDSHTKFIPKDYLHSNFSQRMELLKGLMDGDGCASTLGAAIYITCSKQLAEDVMSLARSLGIKAWLQTTNYSYRVALAPKYKIFKLPRKVVEQHVYSPKTKGSKANAILNKTAILSIKFSHNELGKCVTVDSEDGLYMIGDYVTTHNCNKKGLFPYFQKLNCVRLLTETPQYLRDMQMIKYSAFGSNKYGVNANPAINNYANDRIREWLKREVPVMVKDENNEETMIMMPQLYSIRSRGLLEELIAFDPVRNFDRIRALGMVMLYRESMIIQNGGNFNESNKKVKKVTLAEDDYWKRNYGS
jgi:Homing endonuclease.